MASKSNIPARQGREGNGRSKSSLSTYQSSERWMPRADIYENAEEFMVCADMPGVSPEEVEVSMTDNTLTISGMRHMPMGTEGEEHPVQYWRTMDVGMGIDADKVKADMNNGTLTIRMPKMAANKQQRIKVQAR